MGHNKGQKQHINMGRISNKQFVTIPFNTFRRKLKHKCEEIGIDVQYVPEPYTSKCDALAKETLEHHDTYQGKRITRGLFQSSIGVLINADINGAINIGRTVIPNADQYVDQLWNKGQATCPVQW